jgi:acyl-CoA synthetase (NDP forming)
LPEVRPEGIDVDGARAVTATALASGQDWLSPEASLTLLRAYGVDVCPQRVVSNREQAMTAGAELGYPLAAKMAGGGTHKTEVGGVRLGVNDETALVEAVAMIQAAQPGTPEVLLQSMVPAGIEMIIGALQDELVGPIVMAGVGGVLSDLVADRAFVLAPLSGREGEQMLDRLRLTSLLDGYRGGTVVSRTALADLITRIGCLVADLPETAELDLNPVICNDARLIAVDARIRVAVPRPRADPGLRHLR